MIHNVVRTSGFCGDGISADAVVSLSVRTSGSCCGGVGVRSRGRPPTV